MTASPNFFTIFFFGENGEATYLNVWATRAGAEMIGQERIRPDLHPIQNELVRPSDEPSVFIPKSFKIQDGFWKFDLDYLIKLVKEAQQ